MPTWYRRQELDRHDRAVRREQWDYASPKGTHASCTVDVTVGKPFDVRALKGVSVDEIDKYADTVRENARLMYQHRCNELRDVVNCPCCASPSSAFTVLCVVHDVPYHRCSECGHTFVRRQLPVEAMDEMFAASSSFATPYVDVAAIETRIAQVTKPKLEWVMRAYERKHGRALRSVFDVGAGGGHFVETCRRAGLQADGVEINDRCRGFAHHAFGVSLRDGDFLSQEPAIGMYDAITFWGLLEYTPRPSGFIRAARRWLGPSGMLVVEVPRIESLGSAVQRMFPNRIARHLEPTSHVNVFTDGSLATLLMRGGFEPVAVWYFGMDMYELFVQMSMRLEQPDFLANSIDLIPPLQSALDAARLCDDIVLAAIPGATASA